MVSGHWSGPVGSYYRQKCQFGLYQALHRIRPYNDQPYDRHIFLYTNMPVPGVKVDECLGKTADRLANAGDILNRQLDDQGRCSATELANLLPGTESLETNTRWIRRHKKPLQQMSDSQYQPGKGQRPGRFVRQ